MQVDYKPTKKRKLFLGSTVTRVQIKSAVHGKQYREGWLRRKVRLWVTR